MQDLCMRPVSTSKIFIRQSYMHLDTHITDRYNAYITRIKSSSPCDGYKDCPKNVLITGTPGVGKSMFLIYQLCLARSRKRNVIVQIGTRVCLFSSTPDRFVQLNLTADEKNFLLSNAENMFFYDPGSTRSTLKQQVLAFTVVFASHNPQHYRVLKKSPFAKLYMPVWTLDELTVCAEKCYPTISSESVHSLYEHWGGSPRCVFEEEDDDNMHELEGFLHSENLQAAIRDMSRIETSREPFVKDQWLVHISIVNGDYTQMCMTWPSDYLMSKVTEAMHEQDAHWKTKISRMSDSILHGRLFEADVREAILSENSQLQAIPLPEKGSRPLNIPRPTGHKFFTNLDINLDSTNSLFIPCEPTKASGDFVFKDWIFQATIAEKHAIKIQGIIKLSKQFNCTTWKLCFCIPEGRSSKYTNPRQLVPADQETQLKVLSISIIQYKCIIA